MLLRVADQLGRELGYAEGGDVPGARATPGEGLASSQLLNSEDAALVARLRTALAKIAAALLNARSERAPVPGVLPALEGAELVMRGELISGNAAQLPRLMPSFVFLVALPIVEQDRALELSRRTSELIEEERGV
jgi:hypothetical protein